MIHDWETLQCQCGGSTFIQSSELVWKDGSGLTPRPKGWTCTQCHKAADADAMIRAVKRKHREQEIEELRAGD